MLSVELGKYSASGERLSEEQFYVGRIDGMATMFSMLVPASSSLTFTCSRHVHT